MSSGCPVKRPLGDIDPLPLRINIFSFGRTIEGSPPNETKGPTMPTVYAVRIIHFRLVLLTPVNIRGTPQIPESSGVHFSAVC